VWIDGFVVQRFPVVNADYLAFLNGLVQEGRAADALLYAPLMESAAEGRLGDLLIGYRDGAFSLRSELVDVEWRPDFPMVSVPWDAAVAYARRQSARTGLDWRLIDELRWEKAARGVDGRIYPCGDSFDPSWACLRSSLPGRPFPAAVDSFPVDESVYGVRGCAGNVRDWCLDEFTPAGPVLPATVRVGWPEPSAEASARATQVLRGGGWFCLPEVARMADRYRGERSSRKNYIGFRLARPLPPRLA
jgi:serine/threonine-protein kinase